MNVIKDILDDFAANDDEFDADTYFGEYPMMNGLEPANSEGELEVDEEGNIIFEDHPFCI